MVAEPVQATVETINHVYDLSLNFLANQRDYISQNEYVDKVLALNPFASTSSPQPKLINTKDNSRYLLFFNGRHFTKKKVVLYSSILTIGIGIYTFKRMRGNGVGFKLGEKKPNAESNSVKRRVPKLYNGARRDVILVIGSPTEPLTRLIALDFEKRGFIVYLTIIDEKDLKYVELNPITDDINYLNLNHSYSFELQLTKFQKFLDTPVIPFPGAKPHNLRLKGCVFTPSLYFPIGPIENITVASWAKILERYHVILKLLSSGLISLVRQQQPYSKVIVISSNILSSLNLPYHAPETFYQKSMQNLFASLSREISQHNISVTQVKLGNLNISNGAASKRISTHSPSLSTANLIQSEIRGWDDDMKDLYGESFSKSQYKSNPIKNYSRGAAGSLGVLRGGGSNLRDLYHQLFDLLYPKNELKLNPATVYCGTGARTYDWISSLFPGDFLTWLLT